MAKPPKPNSPNFMGPTFPETRNMQTAPLSSGPAPSSPNFMGPTFPGTQEMRGGYIPPKAPMDPMNPTKPSQMPGQPQVDGNAMATLFATMGANQLQQQREYLADRRIRGVRRDMNGSVIDEATGVAPDSANVFKNGTFQTRDQRIQKEADAFGVSPDETYTGRGRGYLDAQGVTDQMRKQGQAFGGVTTEGPDQDPAPFKGQMMPIRDNQGNIVGQEYMLNPNLPDDKKFKAENFGEVKFGKSTPGPRDPTVPVISDENGPQYYPAKTDDITQRQDAEIDVVRAIGQAKFKRENKATPKQPASQFSGQSAGKPTDMFTDKQRREPTPLLTQPKGGSALNSSKGYKAPMEFPWQDEETKSRNFFKSRGLNFIIPKNWKGAIKEGDVYWKSQYEQAPVPPSSYRSAIPGYRKNPAQRVGDDGTPASYR
jgi:hypothetical protein